MPLQVTKTFLPPLEEYLAYVRQIWQNGWITNGGPFSVQLEAALKDYLKLDHVVLCNNGTIALQLAIRALKLHGEIITTPFSYAASVNAIIWENCQPVFADIDPMTFCLDPAKVEACITPRSSAILAVHVYGIPCDVQALADLAKSFGLKIIYDAAHAFGVQVNGSSVLQYGDITACSFHATKLFHTAEGGMVTCSDPELAQQLILLRQFGHIGETYYGLGINGKCSELHAALGLCMLPHLNTVIAQRKKAFEHYCQLLTSLPVQLLHIPSNVTYNYAYFPVVFPSPKAVQQVCTLLAEQQIFPRKYFFPPLNRLPHVQGPSCPIAENISSRVLALPLSHAITEVEIEQVCSIISKVLNTPYSALQT
ncbi:MAG: DegT/DnrJ/EryC1/StrS family aminotransferase [Chitinophagales bacterium]|nr:DegT/DnrJ/EryC1/StrS family aminotransferase [Chitinophagales bacterium]MDW8428114.1 DegT/DnrJ/EryC1/StrS family aminotransferase [Chitinophagales bacterium]